MSAYARYLTARSIARQPSPIRALTAIQAQAGPEMISLAAGAPNPELFPFESISISLKNGGNGQNGKNHVMQGKELNAALQYSPTIGYGPLRQHFTNLQLDSHNFNPNLHDIVITPGSQDGLMKILVAMVKRGDKVLIDNPAYSGTLAILQPIGANLIEINTDKDGMNTNDLEEKLKTEGAGAKLLITVPNGSNPTGASLSYERRLKLLNVAEKHDLFVIEDDPYYWLTYDTENRVPSLFALENGHNRQKAYSSIAPAGRVLRSDSLSKTISSGIRIGWQTGPKDLIDRVVKHQEASSMHTSTLSQAMVSILFDEWAAAAGNANGNGNGNDGFKNHCNQVVNFYKSRCQAINSSCEKHLSDIATWSMPTAGMFLWVKIDGIKCTRSLIKEHALENNVLLVDGQSFSPSNSVSSYARLSFSQETPERMEEAVERLGKLIREELRRQEKE